MRFIKNIARNKKYSDKNPEKCAQSAKTDIKNSNIIFFLYIYEKGENPKMKGCTNLMITLKSNEVFLTKNIVILNNCDSLFINMFGTFKVALEVFFRGRRKSMVADNNNLKIHAKTQTFDLENHRYFRSLLRYTNK